MNKYHCFSLILYVVPGCIEIDSMMYQGIQEWPVGSGFVRKVDGFEVYEGLPTRPYDVIGLIDVYDDKRFYMNDQVKDKVLKIAEDWGAKALILLSDRKLSSGSLIFENIRRKAVSIDTGRSTQPEIIVEQISGNQTQQVRTTHRRILRSTMLAIRWKSG